MRRAPDPLMRWSHTLLQELRWRDSEILRRQLALVQRNFPVTVAASAVAAVLTVVLTSSMVDVRAMWLWCISHLLIVAAELVILKVVMPQELRFTRNAMWICICMLAMGLSWGVLAFIIVSHGHSLAMLYYMAVVGGVSSGALGLGASLFRAYIIYLVSATGMAAIALFSVGQTPFVGLGLLTLVYLVLTLLQAKAAENTTLRAITLELQNRELVERLHIKSQLALNAKHEAEQANHDKSKFLAAASHDLRQPLHALGLFLDALQDADLKSNQLAILAHAQNASKATRDMLTTLLDYSRLDAGVVDCKPRAFALQTLFDQLNSEFGGLADEKNLILRTRDTAAMAFADPALVNMVLHNLLANAIRYTEHGGILLAARRRRAQWAIEVWDTGMGIPKDQRESIFGEFVQLGNPARDRSKGLGLGLAIVRRLVDTLLAKLELQSTPGRGSCFRLLLPAYHGVLVDESEVTNPVVPVPALKVLLVDDDETVCLAMHTLLTGWGCTCAVAQDISSACALASTQPFDLLMTDYRLRGHETGGQLLERVRALQGAIPAIITTGDTAPQRIRQARQYDAILLHKPVQAHQLRQAMAAAMAARVPPVQPAPVSSAP